MLSLFPLSPCRVTWYTTWAWAIIYSHWILSSSLLARKAHGPLLRWRWLTLTLTVWKSECLKALQSQKSHWNAVLFISMEEAGPWEAQVCPGHLQVVWGCGWSREGCVCDWVWLSWVKKGATFELLPLDSPSFPYCFREIISSVPFSYSKVSWFEWLIICSYPT